jgi:YD repeat-containing protein
MLLSKVVRPDGDTVEFTYDVLGRRLSKTYRRGRHTRWIWDGNVPLHEWVEHKEPQPSAGPAPSRRPPRTRSPRANLNERPAQGPPLQQPPASFTASSGIPARRPHWRHWRTR